MRNIIRNSVWAIAGGLLIWNGSIAIPVALEQLQDKGRPAYVIAYRSWLISPTDITVNLVHVGEEAAPVDIYAALGSASDGCPSSKHLAQVWRGVNGERASSGVGF